MIAIAIFERINILWSMAIEKWHSINKYKIKKCAQHTAQCTLYTEDWTMRFDLIMFFVYRSVPFIPPSFTDISVQYFFYCQFFLGIYLGSIQLAMEVSECNTKSIFICLDEWYKYTGDNQWSSEKNNVCGSIIFHHDMYDIGMFKYFEMLIDALHTNGNKSFNFHFD